MSVTVTVTPLASHAAFNPVEWTATTDRSGATEYAPLTPADAGGFTKFTQAAHVYAVGDVITLTEFSVTAMNTDVVITAIGVNDFTTDLVWDASYAVAGRTTKNNQNLIIQVSVLVGGVVKAIKDVKDFSGFNFDLSGILQGLVTSDEVDTAGARVQSPDPSGSSVVYTLSLQDKWTDKFGTNYSDAATATTTIGGDRIQAFNMALNSETFADYICSAVTPGEFLTNRKIVDIHLDETYQLAFITELASVRLSFSIQNYDTSVTTGSFTVTINNNRGIVLIDSALFPITGYQLTITIREDTADNFIVSETIIFNRRTKCLAGPRLEWKNILGGFDAYTFVESEDKQKAKTQKYQNTTWQTAQATNTQQKKLIGPFLNPASLDWLSEILTSRKITVDGSNAIIMNESLITDSRNFKKPILTIQTDDKITN